MQDDHLKAIASLRLLILDVNECKLVRGKCLQFLSPTLTSIYLRQSGAEDEHMVHLQRFPNLTNIDLWECRSFTSRGLGIITKLPFISSLTKLVVDFAWTASVCLEPLEPVAKLAFCIRNASNDTIVSLERLRGLSYLQLTSGLVTDVGLALLSKLPSLTLLYLASENGITDVGIAKKQQQYQAEFSGS